MGVNNPGINIFAGVPAPGELKTTGRVFYVGNSTTAVPGGITGVDDTSYGDTPQRPFATINYAVTQCTASRSDTIYVLPGHAETVAGTIAVNVAGVHIIGLGVAANRPVLTFDTTTDVVAISAANCEWANIEHVCNVASHTRMIDLQGGADGAYIHDCLFREGSATGLSMVEWTGAADDVRIERNTFYAPTAGNYDEAILIASTPTRGHITNNFLYGDWDEGGINNAVGNIATLFEISQNQITNLLTNVPAINLDSAVTGMMSFNAVSTDTYASALDTGVMRCNGNSWSDATADTGGIPAPAVQQNVADSLTGGLWGTGGLTTFPTGAAAANAVSLAEVLRYAQENIINGTGTALPTNDSLYGVLAGASGITTFPAAALPANGVSIAEVLRETYDQAEKAVTNTTAALVNGTTIFTIAGGPIEIVSLVARCVTANDGTASTLQWSADPTDGAAATFSGASASLASAAAGAMVVLQGTALSTAPTVNATGVGLSFSGATPTGGIVVGAGIITTTVGVGSTTGTWQHHLRYRPLARGVTVS